MNYKIYFSNLKYFFYITAIVMLTNGLLFNYLFLGSFFKMWRQFIWLTGTWFFISFLIANYGQIRKQKFYLHFKWSVLILLIASVVSILINEFNILRILVGWMIYIFGYSFLLLPFIILKNNKEKSFFRFLSWLGIIISIGLILDGLKIISLSLLKNFENTTESELIRATFLTEAATILGISSLFLLICNLYTFHLSKTKFSQIFYLGTSLIFVLGAWFTGSRQVFFVIAFTETIALFYISTLYNRNRILKSLFLIVLIIISLFLIKPLLTSTKYEIYSKRYLSDTDGGNIVRQNAMAVGIKQLSLENLPLWFTGHGFTYTMGQQAKSGEKVGYHMESSVWAMFSECGIFSWYVFFGPLIYSISLWRRLKKSFFKILVFCFLISYSFTAFVSPNASHPLSTMCLFIIMGFLINLRSSESNLVEQKLKI